MKAKLNLSGEGIKQFFLFNGEKIALGAVALILLGFVYSAITAKPLDDSKSPPVIQRDSTALMARIQESNSTPPGGQAHDFATMVDNEIKTLPVGSMKWPTEISPLIFPELKKRSDPTIFPVEELQIASGSAIIGYTQPLAVPGAAPGAVAPAAAGAPAGPAAAGSAESKRFSPLGMIGVNPPGAEPRAKTFAIITGLIPWAKQIEEYSNRFEFAVPPSVPADATRPGGGVTQIQSGQPETPDYYYFNIDRLEITDPTDQKLNWANAQHVLTPKVYFDVQSDIKAWASQWQPSQDIVDQNYLFPPKDLTVARGPMSTYITWPLPPMFLRNWGFEAAHPKVRLNIVEDQTAPQVQPGVEPGKADEFGVAAAPPAATAVGNAAMEHGAAAITAKQGFGANPGFGQAIPYAGAAGSADAVVVDNKLFRFIDLTAEPGKTYRYRVQLVVKSPNFGLLPDCLADANSSKTATLASSWSETGPITIPRDYRLLADSVQVLGRGEPKAKMQILAIVKAKPTTESAPTPLSSDVYLEALKEPKNPTEWIALGGLVELHDLTFDDVPDVPEGGLKRKVEKVNLDTDQLMLLDLRNDDPLGSGRSKGPAEMLFIDSAGNLVTHDSAADKLVVEDYNERTKVPENLMQPNYDAPTPPKNSKGPAGPRGSIQPQGPGAPPPGRGSAKGQNPGAG